MSSGTGQPDEERLVSYAQNLEDVLLWRAFGHLEEGFYVDVGANSPRLSLTRIFYEAGWSGINVEPVDSWFQQLQVDRPRDTNLRLCVSDAPGEIDLFEVVDTGLSTSDPALAATYEGAWEMERIRCQTRTLASIIDESGAKEIHFLKVDVEGMELPVLTGADFERHRPWVVVVESVHPGTHEPSHEAWEPTLLSASYELLWFDGLNRFYGAREHLDTIAPHFMTPPNVLDGFVGVVENDATEQSEIRGQRLHHLSAEHHAARQELNATHELLREELSRRSQLERHAQFLEEKSAAMEAELATLHESLSWRVTAPLRRVLDHGRKLVDARRYLRR